MVIGATGATGKELVKVLLQDNFYSEVVLFVRKSTGISHAKLVEIMTDFGQLENIADTIEGDVLFSCLGTTLKAAGSKEKQFHVDYEIPLKFAEIAKKNGVARVVLLSAYGASVRSMVFYSKVKGQLEEAMKTLAFEQLVIFRPGLLLRKNSDRLGERISAGVLHFLNSIGLLKKFKPLPTDILARKMAKATRFFSQGIHFIERNKIFDL